MSINKALKHDEALSGSITAAIDRLADAMGRASNGRTSVRVGSDQETNPFRETFYNGVGVKRSERISGTKPSENPLNGSGSGFNWSGNEFRIWWPAVPTNQAVYTNVYAVEEDECVEIRCKFDETGVNSQSAIYFTSESEEVYFSETNNGYNLVVHRFQPGEYVKMAVSNQCVSNEYDIGYLSVVIRPVPEVEPKVYALNGLAPFWHTFYPSRLDSQWQWSRIPLSVSYSVAGVSPVIHTWKFLAIPEYPYNSSVNAVIQNMALVVFVANGFSQFTSSGEENGLSVNGTEKQNFSMLPSIYGVGGMVGRASSDLVDLQVPMGESVSVEVALSSSVISRLSQPALLGYVGWKYAVWS